MSDRPMVCEECPLYPSKCSGSACYYDHLDDLERGRVEGSWSQGNDGHDGDVRLKGANTDYIYIKAWHLMTGSYQHYIDALVARARRDGAPENAVYYDDLFRKWVTVDGIASPESRARLLAFAGRLSATSTI